MNDYMNRVEQQASAQGWHIIGYTKERHSSGTVPSGVIAFVRAHPVFDDLRCGTARWADNGLGDTGIMFFNGHYDMSRDDAVEDFTKRTIGFTVGT